MTYNTKKALVDLGFVNGYFYSRPSNIEDDGWHEALMEAFNQVENIAIKGCLLETSPKEADYRRLLHDLGFIRGWAWLKETPDAVSEALTRLIDYFSESLDVTEISFAPPKKLEPSEKMVSDDNRHEITDWYTKFPHPEGISSASGLAQDVVERIVEPIRDMDAEAKLEIGLQTSDEGCDTSDATQPFVGGVTDSAPTEGVVARDTEGSQQRGKIEWAPWQKARLREMKLGGAFTWKQIGDAIGKTSTQCSSMWHWEKQKPDTGEDKSGDGVLVDLPSSGLETPDTEAFNSNAMQDRLPATPAESPVTSAARELEPALTDDDAHVLDEEWPEIQRMLASGSSREKIAGDYDVPVAELNAFIDRKLEAARRRRAAKDSPPGEALASLASLAGGAFH